MEAAAESITAKFGGVRRDQRRSAIPGRADFVEVALPERFRETSAPEGAMLGGSGGYEIALRNGHVIRVLQPFDAATVAQLITAVASC